MYRALVIGQHVVSFVAECLRRIFVLPLYLSWNKWLIGWNSLTWKKWLISLSWKRRLIVIFQVWSLTEFQFFGTSLQAIYEIEFIPGGQWFSNNEMQPSSSPGVCILSYIMNPLFPLWDIDYLRLQWLPLPLWYLIVPFFSFYLL